MKTILELTSVGIVFDTPKGGFEALRDVDLKISDGEFISLIGHSGCGKSTVLNSLPACFRLQRAVPSFRERKSMNRARSGRWFSRTIRSFPG